MTQRALITGCAGFIGSNLCEALLGIGWEVFGIDCFTDNYNIKFKEQNISSMLLHSKFKFIPEDLMNTPINEHLKNIDFVFHQSGQPGVRGSWGRQFDKYVTNNILVTQRLLEAVKNSDIKKFVYASSSSAYGNTSIQPMGEHLLPKPFSPYGLTKLAAENLCHLYYENYGVPVISLRYFTVFGPRQRPDMAISIFIKSIMSGIPIKIYGDGRQKRDFTYVDDIVRANMMAANSSIAGEVFNVGSGRPIELMDVLRIVEDRTGKKAEISYCVNQKGDVPDTYADIGKINRVLGYEPLVSFEDGVSKQIEYMRTINEI